MQDDIKNLIRQLDGAFGDLTIPPDDQIVYDNSGYHLECNDIRDKFRGLHWRDIPIDDLIGESDSLGFLTPEAFRFLLPAFIKVVLLDPERADLIPDSILSKFADLSNLEYWKGREKALIEGAQSLGVPEEVAVELVTAVSSDPEEDVRYRRELLAVFSTEQKGAMRSFIHFLRRYRAEDFRHGELDRVEQALAS